MEKNGYYMSILLISYYLESDGHVRYKVKMLNQIMLQMLIQKNKIQRKILEMLIEKATYKQVSDYNCFKYETL